MVENKVKFERNGYSGYLHEAMQTTHIIMTMVEEHLSQHPATLFGGKEKAIDKVQEALSGLYQEYGHIDSLNDAVIWKDDGNSLEDVLKMPLETQKAYLSEFFESQIDMSK